MASGRLIRKAQGRGGVMKITITPRGFTKNGMDYIQLLKDRGHEVEYNDTGKSYTREQFFEHCKDSVGVICASEKVDSEFFDANPQLKCIIKFGVGVDNIDVEYAQSKGVFVGRCAGSNSRSVAEHAMTLMLAASKNLYDGIYETKNKNWKKFSGFEILGKTLGIIGFGAIGKHFAAIAKGLGMDVLCYDSFPIENETAKEYNVSIASLEEIYEESDFISVHVPLNEETRNMISLPEMKKMKNSCILINTARGGIINEDDLYTALKEGIIKAAYFDVFSSEPPKEDEKLLDLENFYLTPHMAASTKEADINCCRMSTEILLDRLGDYL